jgi:hypothetical protein
MDMLAQDVLEAGAGHGIIASIGEQFWNSDFSADGQPCSNRGCRFFPQGQATFFSAFAVALLARNDPTASVRTGTFVRYFESRCLAATHFMNSVKRKPLLVFDEDDNVLPAGKNALSCWQIVFSVWVTLNEQKWVTFGRAPKTPFDQRLDNRPTGCLDSHR